LIVNFTIRAPTTWRGRVRCAALSAMARSQLEASRLIRPSMSNISLKRTWPIRTRLKKERRSHKTCMSQPIRKAAFERLKL